MRYIFLAIIFSFSFTQVSAQQPIPKSKVEGPVNDFADLLSRSQQDALARKLVTYADETSTQLVLITETTLAGEDDFTRAMAIFDDWKIGQAGKDNGVLLYVAKNERKVRFVTGYGAEGFLPDAMAKRLIENIIVPNFKKGDFYTGIDRAFDAVRDLAKGEYTNDNPRSQAKRDAKGFPVFILVIILIVVIVVIARNSGGGDDDDDGGYYRGGRYDMDRRRRNRRRGRRNRSGGGGGWIFFPGGGFSGGGSGGGGGGFGGFDGGFSGGFGGGFSGGGGAGGSW
jgi:uncharacterized protein